MARFVVVVRLLEEKICVQHKQIANCCILLFIIRPDFSLCMRHKTHHSSKNIFIQKLNIFFLFNEKDCVHTCTAYTMHIYTYTEREYILYYSVMSPVIISHTWIIISRTLYQTQRASVYLVRG